MQMPVEHDLRSLLSLLRDQIFTSMNCHAVGKVESVNFSEQTIQGSIAYRKDDGIYPVLVDCPMVIMGGGSGSIRFPVAAGDSCLFLFNDRDIDNWFSGGGVVLPNTARKHSFSDAFALIGPRSLSQSLSDYVSDRTELVHGETKVSLKEKVKIENASENLLTALNQLYSALDAFFTATSSAAVEPTLGPAAVTAKAAVAAAKLAIEGILE